jgi:hypothetical protein
VPGYYSSNLNRIEMKKVITLMCIGIILMSFESFQIKALNTDLIGSYEYKTPNSAENHFIVIDTIKGKFSGRYYGTEDGSGHGVFFYENEMKNLNIANNNISFEIEKRELFQTTRFKAEKKKIGVKAEKSIGFSNTVLFYTGTISNQDLKLNCESKYGDCWEKGFKFKKNEKNSR